MEDNQKLIAYQKYLVSWIQQEVKKAKMNGVIVGISGGVDSAVVGALAKAAFPQTALGVLMPTTKDDEHYQDAQDLVATLKLQAITVNLATPYQAMQQALNISDKLAIANIQPRLRMTALYALAQERKLLVLGTDNAAEWILGYFTKYGDGGVDLLPIIHLKKGEVQKLAALLKLPPNIYQKAPTANLWANQTDEQELGFSYQHVDQYLAKQKIPHEIKAKIEHQKHITQHKRNQLPRPLPLTTFDK